MVTKRLAVVLFLGLTANFCHGIDRNKDKCLNMKGEHEICGPLQFCSSSLLHKGCRNCTDVADSWCTGEEQISEFKKRYPQCGILCELKKCSRLKEEMNATGAALSKCKMEKAELEETLEKRAKEIDELKEENDTLRNAVVVVSCVAAVVWFSTIFGMAIYISKRKQRHKAQAAGITDGTASVECDRPFWKRFCSCLPIFKKGHSRAVQPQDPEAPSTSFLSESTDSNTQASDSGHASSLSDARLPTGGTLHHPSDTNDFMQNAQISAACGGGVNDTTATTAITVL